MANQSQGNGRNVALPEEKRPSWRPQDEGRRRNLSEEDDRYERRYGSRYWEDRDEPWRTEGQRYPEGRGRYAHDQSYGQRYEDRGRERDWEDRGADPERYGAQGGYGGGRGWAERDRSPERAGVPLGYGYEADRPLARGYGAYGAEGRGYGSYGEGRAYEGGRERGAATHEEPRGGFRGRGPQGYRRSDERLRELVCEALTDDDRVDASHIDVRVENGEVTLTGTVEDRQQKRCAEDAIEQVGGVRDIHNQVRVQSTRT